MVEKAALKTQYPQGYDGTKVQISKLAVKGRHLWMAGLLGLRGRGGQIYFMSDEMYAAYRKEKFQGLKFQCSAYEIEKPWIPEENMGAMLQDWHDREDAISQNWPKVPARHGGTV